ELKISDIEEIPSSAITSLYRCNNPNILEQSLTSIEFRSFLIRIDKYIIYITALGYSNEAEVEVRYTVIFTSEHLGKYKFTYAELEEKLSISSKTVSSARLYAAINSSSCLALCKSIITR
ncbi:3774_t:CDS:2, partial [Scutellospora calospora]